MGLTFGLTMWETPEPYTRGISIEAKGASTTAKYINVLPVSAELLKRIETDQEHSLGNARSTPMMVMVPTTGLMVGNPERFLADPPIVAHLHGAEVSSFYDGDPDQWFTPNGLHGMGYKSLTPTDPNAAIYYYPNTQEATTLWYHDHVLGATRPNVYSGLAASYLLRDHFDTGLAE